MNHFLVRHGYAARGCFKHHGNINPLLRTTALAGLYARELRLKSSTSTRRSPQKPLNSTFDGHAAGLSGQSDTELAAAAARISADPKYACQGIVSDLSTTRPAPLDLPEPPNPYAWPSSRSRDPSKWDYGYLFKLGKAYAKFFITGFKNVWANFMTMQKIQKRLGATSLDDAARSATAPQRLSYNEYELCLRTKRDLRKLIPFGLIFAICGEFTPLVILAFGPRVVPGTCVIPKQQDRITQTMLNQEQEYIRRMAERWPSWTAPAGSLPNLDTLPGPLFFNLRRLGLVSAWQLSALAQFRGYFVGRMARHCNEVLNTAILVQREGGWSQKSPQDMWEWGVKYGMYRLRKYAELARSRGEDPVSEDMKVALLPFFEQETRQMIRDAASCASDKLWMAAYHDPLYFADRPDCKLQKDDIELLQKTITEKDARSR